MKDNQSRENMMRLQQYSTFVKFFRHCSVTSMDKDCGFTVKSIHKSIFQLLFQLLHCQKCQYNEKIYAVKEDLDGFSILVGDMSNVIYFTVVGLLTHRGSAEESYVVLFKLSTFIAHRINTILL